MASVGFSLNKIQLIGSLGKDLEVRAMNDFSVGEVSLATSFKFKKKDGDYSEETTWHNLKIWNPSDYLTDNLKKGNRAYFEGRLSIEKFTDKNGVERQKAVVVVDKVIPLGSGRQKTQDDVFENTAKPQEDETDLPF